MLGQVGWLCGGLESRGHIVLSVFEPGESLGRQVEVRCWGIIAGPAFFGGILRECHVYV